MSNRIKQVSNETENAMLRKSAYGLPNRPSESGMRPDDIKKAFYKSLIDGENSLLSELKRIVDEANAILGQIDTYASGHANSKNNPHSVTKSQVGLGSVDNTSDVNKPVSTAQQTALNQKLDKSSLVDNLTTNSATQPLTARQGKALKDMINTLNSMLTSDNTNLDTLQEIVDFVESNKTLIDSITTNKVNVGDVRNDLLSEDTNKPLSAKQGKVLKGLIDALSTIARTGKLSDVLEDENHRSVTDIEKSRWDSNSGYNPNLLINGDFKVNQRGKSRYANSTYYTADGWQLGKNNDGYFDVSTKTLSCGKSGTYSILTQYVNVDIVALKGKQLTLSADIKGDGVNTVYLQFGYFTGSEFTQIAANIIRNAPTTMSRYVVTGTIPDNVTSVNRLSVRPYINAGHCVIDNIKLEFGAVATPYSQRPYSEELAICQMPLVSGNQNLSTTYSNENILINGDFRVNQRNFTSTTDIGFTVDRWKNTRTNTLVTLNDDGTITLSNTPTQNNNTLLTQKLEEKDYKNLLGGAITVSAMVSLDEGQTYNVYSITAVLPQTLPTTTINNETYFTDDAGVRHGSVRQYWTGSQFVVDVFGYNGYNVRVKWVKLEKGEIATPYNPRPYAEELAMCQRYYQVVNVEGIVFSTFGEVVVDGTSYYGANALVSLPISLRTKPTVMIDKLPYIRNYNLLNAQAVGYNEIVKFGNNIICLQFYNPQVEKGIIYYAHDGMAILDAEIY